MADKKELYVTFKVIGTCTVKVNAENVNEALKLADEEFMNVNLGEEMELQDSYPVYIEDNNWNRVWED